MTARKSKNEHALVTNVSTFQSPILAIRDGKTVRLLAIGNQEGKSPVYLTVDDKGMSMWETIQNVRIVDSQALPVSTDALAALTETLQQLITKE